MRQVGIQPDVFTFPTVNRAISCLQDGGKIHSLAIQMGFASNVYFCNTLIGMYGRCGCVDSASRVFDEMPLRDVVSWTSMISCYVREEMFTDCFGLIYEMRRAEIEPNSVTIVTMMQACGMAGNAVGGTQFHAYSIKRGFGNYELVVNNSILSMYVKTGCFEDAEVLFNNANEKDAVSWNIMISGYSGKGNLLKVADSFNEMRLEVVPSLETLTLVISSFAKAGELRHGQGMHAYSVKSGLNDVLLQTSIVDFYAKCGEMEKSFRLFDDLPDKNSDSWSVLMSGFIQNGYFREAIELFSKMQIANVKPSTYTLRSIILAYSHLGALKLGKGAHAYMIRKGLYGHKDNASMETTILNMYAKCGSISSARTCFKQMAVKDVIAWSSMIEGYGIHGLGSKALELFEHMQTEGVAPNSVTFLSMLSACSHSGLVNEGCIIFCRMSQEFGIIPTLDHYTCLVDLLGRSGKLQEALTMIETMTAKPDSRIWGALLAACRTYSDNALGIYVAQSLFDMEPENAGYHVVLSNVHVSGGRWNEAEYLRNLMTEKDLNKKPGWSCIETKEGFHGFVAGDRSHPQAGEIYWTLVCLKRSTEEVGYVSHY
ncbi:hypothetical protein AAC387_Pa04g0535 [Persea americana]